MTILDQLLKLMLEKVEVTPVPKQELDEFLSQHDIKMCDEHYQFLLNYGNSKFFKHIYSNLTFDDSFKWYYTTDNFLDDMILPENCGYLGTDFDSETICFDYIDKKIYYFDSGDRGLCYYYGLKELLFFYVFKYMKDDDCFDKVEENIEIEDLDKFKAEYFDYEINGIFLYEHYFFKDGKLIVGSENFYYYSIYYGGILDKVIDDR